MESLEALRKDEAKQEQFLDEDGRFDMLKFRIARSSSGPCTTA